MTKQTSKIIMLIMLITLTSALVSLTACRHVPFCRPARCVSVCPENLKEGLATIICQPMDTDFSDNQKQVEFEVQAVGSKRTYQWYFIGPTNVEALPERSDLPPDKRDRKTEYIGFNTEKLTIKNPTIDDCGNYYCEIISSDCAGWPAKTQTRQAVLSFSTRALILTVGSALTIIQSPPVPGHSPMDPHLTSCSRKDDCSYMAFQNIQVHDDAKYSVVVFPTTATGTPATARVPSSQYEVAALDENLNMLPCPDKGTNDCWQFTLKTTHTYKMCVFFDCDGPPPKPTGQYPKIAFILQK